ncbi:MAG TPA: energy transducer TonB [Candidatus Dormibacteraeota bacterium]|nr:energy transducer TonB [Candidatus Dormibacteraeota bacterium]
MSRPSLSIRCFVLCSTLSTLFAGAAGAQTPVNDQNISSLAVRLAEVPRKMEAKRVVILDLRGSRREAHPAGKWLADRLSVTLQKELPAAEIVDRSQIKAEEIVGTVEPGLSDVRVAALEVGRVAGADTIVTGTFVEVTKGALSITLNAFKSTTSGMRADEITADVQEPPEVTALSPEPVPTHIARADVGLGKPPTCGHCPLPEYTDEARRAHYQGSVTLDVLVTSQGRVEKIVVVKSPGLGLTEKAIGKVRTWRLKPALDPHGQPINVRVIVEVAFRMRD